MSPFAKIVRAEIISARANHGPMASAHEAFAVILEELEEFKAEVFKKRAERSNIKMLSELTQVAAMCQRAAEDLSLIDPDMELYPTIADIDATLAS